MNRRAALAAVAIGALTLAACGGDDDSGDSSTDAPVPSESAGTTAAPSTDSPTTVSPTTEAPGTDAPGTEAPGTEAPTSDAPVTPGEGWPDKLVLTLTPSQEAGGLVDTAQPLADALAAATGLEVEAIVPSDYASVIVALQSGQAQIAGGLGPSQMVQAEDTAGADLILQSVRFGSSQYVTQWFTNNPDTFCDDAPVADEDGMLFCNGVGEASDPTEGPIGLEHLGDVAGTTVAFVDQGSTSGYLIPALELLQAGVDPLTGITGTFAGGHDSAVQAVYDGDAEVGVSFNDARGQLVETVPDVGEQVVVFAWSEPIPNDGFAVAGDLPDDLKQLITQALIDYAETEEGAATLDELYEIDGLVPVPPGSYDIIRSLETELGDLLG